MRSLMAMTVIAVLAFCVLAHAAQAQGVGTMAGRGRHEDAPPKADKTTKADEKAYKDALKRIPEKKVDPWGNMR